MFCDECDRAIHTFCLDPPLFKVPEGIFCIFIFISTHVCLPLGHYQCEVCKGMDPSAFKQRQRSASLRTQPDKQAKEEQTESNGFNPFQTPAPRKRGRPPRSENGSTTSLATTASKKSSSQKPAKITLQPTPSMQPPIQFESEPDEEEEPQEEENFFASKLNKEESDYSKYTPDENIRRQAETAKLLARVCRLIFLV